MKSPSIKYLLVTAIFISLFASCRPDNPVPKRRGYPRFEFPERAYQQFDSTSFPFTFEYPVYGTLEQDVNLNKEENAPYWININFKDLNATIYLSYKEINSENSEAKLVEESFRLTEKHDVKADRIDAPQIKTRNGLSGVFYAVGGNAASAYQFFLTDKTKHFIRGALYFNVTPNADSLMPANDFLKKDMEHLIETFRFK